MFIGIKGYTQNCIWEKEKGVVQARGRRKWFTLVRALCLWQCMWRALITRGPLCLWGSQGHLKSPHWPKRARGKPGHQPSFQSLRWTGSASCPLSTQGVVVRTFPTRQTLWRVRGVAGSLLWVQVGPTQGFRQSWRRGDTCSGLYAGVKEAPGRRCIFQRENDSKCTFCEWARIRRGDDSEWSSTFFIPVILCLMGEQPQLHGWVKME